MDLEQAKNLTQSTCFYHSSPDGLCRLCNLLALSRDLIAEIKSLRQPADKIKSKDKIPPPVDWKPHIHIEDRAIQDGQLEADLEAKLCVIRELYDLHQSNRPDLPLAVRAKIAFRMEELFQAVLSSASTCSHEAQVVELTEKLNGK